MDNARQKDITKLAKKFAISGIGSIFGLFWTPLTSVITTRFLGAELYGIFSLVQSWGSLLANLSSIGLNGMNLRFIPTYKATGSMALIKGSVFTTIRVSVVISAAATCFILFFPDLFCELFIHRPETISEEYFSNYVTKAFQFYAVSILLTASYQAFLSSLVGYQFVQYKVLANDVLGPAAKIISLTSLLLLDFNLYAALGSNIIQDIVVLLVSAFYLFRIAPELRDKSIPVQIEKKKMMKFSSALFANSLLSKYTYQLDILFLGYYATLPEIGIYTLALRLQPLIYLPHYSISSVFGPMVAELYTAGKIKELNQFYKTTTKWSVTLSLPICSLIILFSKEILGVFGKEFAAGFELVAILSIGNLIHDFLGLSGNIILMTGRIRINVINSIVMAIINLLLMSILIRNYGMYGAAIGNFLSITILSILTTVETFYILKIHPFDFLLLKPFFAMLISSSIVIAISIWYRLPYYEITFLIYILVFILLYVGFLFLFGLSQDDRMILDKILKKLPFKKQNSNE
ncbi:MAG TPA: oligosaccharide flippase family protein [bacterium]|nr:oligosaccharide flippase family protein [bacterium]HMW31886.1 oligosaccharide flippase family protein [bacterium]HMW34954.1 oligosaccharide flippase family protein [bacterium]HMY35603.1 oligosaccharide flippase family protein [bacterium]HMZ02997.1 oligosaccharide flippase family protein [bacterium]